MKTLESFNSARPQETYNYIIKEYFDITDNETRTVLVNLHEEAEQNKALLTLTSKLYDNIVEKVDDIDFGDIPSTKGDVTKLPNYDKLVDCLSTMRNILMEYKQDTEPVDRIELALSNLRSRKDMFEKAYRYNIELPMVLYSSVYLAIISSMSLMITSTIDFVKVPSSDSFKIIVDKVGIAKSKNNLLFDNLEKFNRSCAKGEIDNVVEYIIKNNMKNFTGIEFGVIASGIAIFALVLNIIPIMRELVFFFFYSRTRVSEYFDAQADLLQINAYNLESNSKFDKDEQQKIAKKQLKLMELFRSIANKLAISNRESEVKATKDIVGMNKKYKATEVFDELPDSGASALF